MESETEQAWD